MARAADLMTASVPVANPDDPVSTVLALLKRQVWEEASHVYLIDAEKRLVGQVPIETVLRAQDSDRLKDLQGRPPIEVPAEADAETVALLAVERHETDVAVLNDTRVFLGAIPIGRLLALLHEEHVDDLLRMGGVSRLHPILHGPAGIASAYRARLPWLLIGLCGGFLAGAVAGFFEASLKREIALAFFLPLVVYMADAVGTQTETILVRALAAGAVALGPQMMREAAVGLCIGVTVGGLAGTGLWLWSGDGSLALVVGTTLAVTPVIATLVASLLPLALDRFGADPALASGPVATVVQDILSVAVYLGIATVMLA